ncbi:Triose-phosphate Transporter [Dinochytrium kinnereticum]|nr:Triose-phosphate Transporter [Dinochytrium kinnereticum]
MFSGLRWNLTQILIASKSQLHFGPVTTLNNLSPMMMIFLGLGSLIMESHLLKNSPFFASFYVSIRTIGLLSIGGLLALFMTLSEFYLISKTNGIFKEVFMISLSIVIFGDRLTPIAILGVAISIAGIAAYTMYKFHKRTHGEKEKVYSKVSDDDIES